MPIPVLNESILESILLQDWDIPLTIMDVNIRQKIGKTTYEDVWGSSDLEIEFDPGRCARLQEMYRGAQMPHEGDHHCWRSGYAR